jgi:hypothetical protein
LSKEVYRLKEKATGKIREVVDHCSHFKPYFPNDENYEDLEKPDLKTLNRPDLTQPKIRKKVVQSIFVNRNRMYENTKAW